MTTDFVDMEDEETEDEIIVPVSIPTSTNDDSPKVTEPGICSVCGTEAVNSRSTYCEDHIPERRPSIRVAPLPTPDKKSPASTTKTDADKTRAIRALSKSILSANPYVVKVSANWIQAPENWLDDEVATLQRQLPSGEIQNVTFWKPSLRKQLEVTKKQADALAKALIDLSETPQARMVVAFASAAGPYVTLLSAIGVVGMYAMKMTKLRQDVVLLKELHQKQLEQQQAMRNITPHIPTGMEDATEISNEAAPGNFEA